MNGHRRALDRMARRLYASALLACPAAFRQEHAVDMQATFDAMLRDAPSRGGAYIVGLLAREVADLIAAALRLRLRHLSAGRHQRRQPVRSLLQDVQYAWRMTRRQPGFAAIVLVTLGLGVGATTAVFTVVNGVLLRPLPYADPDRLVVLVNGRAGRLGSSFSPLNFVDVTTQSGVFESAAAVAEATVNLTGQGDPVRLEGAAVTWPFFSVLGVAPRAGRLFVESDAADANVVVLSDGLWRRQFGGRADIVGATLTFDGIPVTVIGIAPPDVKTPATAQFWRPLVFTPRDTAPAARGAQWVSVVARLKADVDIERANSAMATVAARLAEDFPLTNRGRLMSAQPMHERMVRNVRQALWVLLGAVTLVLLIACVNVANLLLARAHGRAREVAVRAALGAGRARLVRQFLSESLLLGVAGGVAGLAVAFACVRVLVLLGPASIPRLADIAIDWRVLAFTSAAAVGTSVLFGLVPAIATTSGAMGRFISSAGRGSIGHAGTRTRKVLVVCEMALAVVLLAGAGLLVRSYERIMSVDPGFAPDRVLTFSVALPEAKYTTSDQVGRFVAAYVDRLRQRPGVERAAAVFGLPLDDNFGASSSFLRQGEVDAAESPAAGMRIITPDYFAALKIPLRLGRPFNDRDDGVAPEVVIINETAARRYWPGVNPVGQQIKLGVRLVRGVRSGQKTVVGVVGDVKYASLDAPTPAEVYLPHAQHPVDALSIAVRTSGDPMAFVPAARAELGTLDRELPIAAVHTMDEIVGQSVAQRRFTMLLLVAFAIVAVALAAIGIYGVLAFVVSQRTTEIGLRLAIGAAPIDVVRLFVREGAVLMVIGLAVGLAGALAARQSLAALLFDVTPTDPVTFAGVGAALAIVAMLASYLPARRAARVDPMEALRSE